MKPPRNWRRLQRHPLSAEYPDLGGRSFDRLVDRLKRFGVFRKRKVLLLEGKVFDGWQLYRGCLEANVEPLFEKLKLPSGMSLEDAVEIVNDIRRHETQDAAVRRAEERRERVAAARAAGQSLRTIASMEGINESTVRDDIKRSGAGGGAPETVRGMDGKTYTATKPSPEREPGDDTETEEAEKGARSRNGKPLIDWKQIDKHYHPFMRTPEVIGGVFKAEKQSDEYRRLSVLLDEVAVVLKRWRKRLNKVKE